VKQIIGMETFIKQSKRHNFNDPAKAMFRFEGGAAGDTVFFERFCINPGTLSPITATVVSDATAAHLGDSRMSPSAVRCRTTMIIGYNNEPGAGPVFFDDVVGLVRFDQPQKAWMRHYNTEGAFSSSPAQYHTNNNGGTLWILGLKTEKRPTIIETTKAVRRRSSEATSTHPRTSRRPIPAGRPRSPRSFVTDFASVVFLRRTGRHRGPEYYNLRLGDAARHRRQPRRASAPLRARQRAIGCRCTPARTVSDSMGRAHRGSSRHGGVADPTTRATVRTGLNGIVLISEQFVQSLGQMAAFAGGAAFAMLPCRDAGRHSTH